MFEYRSTNPGTVFYKTDLNSSGYSSFVVCNVHNQEVPLPILRPVATEPLQLSNEKLADLKSLMPYIGNKLYYEALMKSLVVPKRGRKAKTTEIDEYFDDDQDPVDEDDLS